MLRQGLRKILPASRVFDTKKIFNFFLKSARLATKVTSGDEAVFDAAEIKIEKTGKL